MKENLKKKLEEKLKNITKTDIVASIVYLVSASVYLILNQYYLKLSPNINFLILLIFLGSAELYRNLKKKYKFKFLDKNVVKRVTASFLIFSIVGIASFSISNINNNKTVYAYSTGIREKRIPISIHFTAKQCETIANRGSRISSWSGWISFISGFTGKRTGLAGGLIGAFGMGIVNNLKPFETAKSMRRGLTIKYTYVIPPYTNIGRIENSRYYYY